MTQKTDHQLLEELHVMFTAHCARHEASDQMIARMAKSLYGNGSPGVVTKVQLLMWLAIPVGAVLSCVATIVLTHFFKV